jgi:hypothetical protein
MTVRRKDKRVTVTTDDTSPDARSAIAEIMGNLTPEAQRSRLLNRLEQAAASGMPDNLYQAIRQELDGGHIGTAKDSLQRWAADKSRSHGGRSMLLGIQHAVEDMLEGKPKITNADAWNWFPEPGDPYCVETDVADFEIYRDGGKLVQIDQTANKENSISKRSFQDYYLAPARKSRSM